MAHDNLSRSSRIISMTLHCRFSITWLIWKYLQIKMYTCECFLFVFVERACRRRNLCQQVTDVRLSTKRFRRSGQWRNHGGKRQIIFGKPKSILKKNRGEMGHRNDHTDTLLHQAGNNPIIKLLTITDHSPPFQVRHHHPSHVTAPTISDHSPPSSSSKQEDITACLASAWLWSHTSVRYYHPSLSLIEDILQLLELTVTCG